MKTKIFLYSTLITSVMVFFVTFTTNVLAQPGLPGAPSQAPIDGGLGLLAAAGGAYALKKSRDKKNKVSDIE